MRPPATALRPFLRTRLPHHPRRFASTSTENAQKKAQDALGSAQRVAQQLWAGTVKFLGPVGERAGSLLGSYREPLIYNFSVARELAKQIYIAERLQPPTSLHVLQTAYSAMWQRARNVGYWREIARTGEWKKVGIYAVEAYGIFKIGEIVGRRSLVGYDLH